MKRGLFLFIVLNTAFSLGFSQAGMWTWVRGDTVALYSPGNYGTKGVPSPTNDPPGRYACGQWTDTAGNFWIYAGYGNYEYGGGLASKYYADLWKFDPSTGLWTFMNGSSLSGVSQKINSGLGVYDPLNTPGHLYIGMFTWTTSDNRLWLVGGKGYTTDNTESLWQYDPAINQWAWMGYVGPTNYGTKGIGNATTKPGKRIETSTAWVDSIGNLWLFGGSETAFRNDMWKYDVKTGFWTWMSGTNLPNDTGYYGALGVPSSSGVPPARQTNLAWKDDAGNFWLSGGRSSNYFYQDVWKFDPQTLEWTWVSGPVGSNSNSVFNGSNCDTSEENREGPIFENRPVWKVCNNIVMNWARSQLWAYILPIESWTRISTAPFYKQRYGTKGVADPANYPPLRIGPASFLDKNKNLWMFAGHVGTPNYYDCNDLWKYTVDPDCLGDFACPTCSSSQGGVITALQDTVCVDQPPVLHFSGVVQNVQWQYSTDSINYNDLPGLTGEDCLDIPTQTSYYRVKSTDGNCPLTTEPIKIVVDPSCSITYVDGVQSEAVNIYPNPSSVAGCRLTVAGGLVGSNLEVYDANGSLVFFSKLTAQSSHLDLPLSKGVYFIRIHSEKVVITKRIVRL